MENDNMDMSWTEWLCQCLIIQSNFGNLRIWLKSSILACGAWGAGGWVKMGGDDDGGNGKSIRWCGGDDDANRSLSSDDK
jgi:hypothetical protein